MFMGRGNKRLSTFDQIILIWIMMVIWGGLLFLCIYVVVFIYNILMGY
jgi:hypothetical protein